jgi:hypothetical protein
VNEEPQTAPTDERATGWTPRSLWFTGPLADEEERRRPLTRQRVVTEALTIIAYRHVRNKEQLQDLVLDGVLAEVDCGVDPSLPWTERIKLLAHRLRAVLEDHPGVAALLKLRDPLGPHSLALAEAFLSPLHAAGFPDREAGLAFFLLVDYTIGFAVASTRTSVNEQRVRDTTTRNQLHEFFRTLPGDRFTTSLDVIVDGLDRARGVPTLTGDHQRHIAESP